MALGKTSMLRLNPCLASIHNRPRNKNQSSTHFSLHPGGTALVASILTYLGFRQDTLQPTRHLKTNFKQVFHALSLSAVPAQYDLALSSCKSPDILLRLTQHALGLYA